MLQNGQYVTVEKVQHEILEKPITVYNFEVEGLHTYFVGESSVLVHNMCATPKATKHGVYRIAGRNFSEKELNLLRASKDVRRQADGAKIFVRAINKNSYSVLVEGKNDIITAMKNLTKHELNNLTKNYGWYR